MHPLNAMKSCRASLARSALVLLILLLTTAVASADGIHLAEGDRAYRAKDYTRASYLYQTACARQWGLGCYKLGLMLEKGEGVKIDKDRAKYFFRRGCDLEVPIACASMTGDALKIEETARLAAKPEEELKKSCGGRVCKKTIDGQYIFRTETGKPQRWYFQDGRLAPRSVWPKVPAQTEATEKRDSGSVPLASAVPPEATDLPLSQQASMARREGEHSRARTLFEQACAGGDAKACFEVGHMFRMGSGGASDDTQARVFYEKACTGGDARGCFNLGFLFSGGIGGPQDSARAQALYEQACQAGEPSACSRLNTMQRRPKSQGGRGLKAPPAAR